MLATFDIILLIDLEQHFKEAVRSLRRLSHDLRILITYFDLFQVDPGLLLDVGVLAVVDVLCWLRPAIQPAM